MEPVVLRSARLTLSTPTADDVDAITSCCQDYAVQAWTTVPSPYTRTDAIDFVTNVVEPGWASNAEYTWGIRLGRGLAGMVGLSGIVNGGAEVGFWLAPEARGAGVMSEAVALVRDFAFGADGPALQRIQWHAFIGNTASAGVARATGFRFEGVQRLGGVQRGQRLDQWSAALLDSDSHTVVTDGWPSETFLPVAGGARTSGSGA